MNAQNIAANLRSKSAMFIMLLGIQLETGIFLLFIKPFEPLACWPSDSSCLNSWVVWGLKFQIILLVLYE